MLLRQRASAFHVLYFSFLALLWHFIHTIIIMLMEGSLLTLATPQGVTARLDPAQYHGQPTFPLAPTLWCFFSPAVTTLATLLLSGCCHAHSNWRACTWVAKPYSTSNISHGRPLQRPTHNSKSLCMILIVCISASQELCRYYVHGGWDSMLQPSVHTTPFSTVLSSRRHWISRHCVAAAADEDSQ